MKLLLAYLDPSNGSFIVQAVIGAILGVSYFARTHIKAIFGRFRGSSKKKPEAKKKSETKENE